MTAISLFPELKELAPEVLLFLRENGLEEHFPALLDATRRIFPDRSIRVFLDADREIADLRYIVVDVDTTADNAEQLMSGYRAWQQELLRLYSPTQALLFLPGLN